jgi:tartrate dehydratase beta subunit/fumarate hydratase class I family protein
MLGNRSLYDQQALFLLLRYVGPLHTITHSSGVVRDMDLADQQRDLGDNGKAVVANGPITSARMESDHDVLSRSSLQSTSVGMTAPDTRSTSDEKSYKKRGVVTAGASKVGRTLP